MKNKKICFFTNSMFKLGGEQRIVSILANGLVKSGFEVTIIIKNNEDINYEMYKLSKSIKLYFLHNKYKFKLNNNILFEYLRLLNRKTGIFKNNKKLIKHFFASNKMFCELKNFFINNKFDYVIGVAGDRSFILSYLKKYISGRLIFWNHQAITAHFKNKGTRYYNEEKFIIPLFKNFDKIILLSKDDQKLLKKYYSIDSTVIYNCKSFSSKFKSNLNNGKFIAIGRLTYQKGFDLLIDAMKNFSNHNLVYKLDIYGEGKDYKKLKRKIKKYHLDNNISILPPCVNIEKIYVNYDAFLMSSRYEGFGLVTIEAMECGLPIIAFDIPVNKEIIKNKVNGILVPSYDTSLYSKTMLEFANSYELRKKYANNTMLSLKNFTEEQMLENWLKILI